MSNDLITSKKPIRIPTCAKPPYHIMFECGQCKEPITMVDGQQELFKYCNKCGWPIDWGK